MKRDYETEQLLKKAERLLRDPVEDIATNLEKFKEEYADVKSREEAAYKRMKEQDAAGEKTLAALSRKAYRFSRNYAKKLDRIIKSLELQAKVLSKTDGRPIMTKQSKKRYVDEEYIDGLKNFYDQQ